MNSRVGLIAEGALGLHHQEITAGDTRGDLMTFPVWQRGGEQGGAGEGRFWGMGMAGFTLLPEILRTSETAGTRATLPA